jgi:hypothetical protein
LNFVFAVLQGPRETKSLLGEKKIQKTNCISCPEAVTISLRPTPDIG